MSIIDEIRSYAKLTADCEKIIEAGPQPGNLSLYAEELSKLMKAHKELISCQLKKFYKVVDKVEQLIKQGTSKLREYVRNAFAAHFRTIDAAELVKQGQRPPTLGPDGLTVLSETIDYIPKFTNSDNDDILLEVITRYIQSSLTPLSKSTKPRITNAPYEKGSNTIHVYTQALKGFIAALEIDLSNLFPGKDESVLFYFDEITSRIIKEFIGIISSLNIHIQSHIQTDRALTFELFECTGQVINSIKAASNRIPTELTDLIDQLRYTAKLVFQDFIKYIESRVQGLTTLPNDNGICEATVEILSRLSRIADYKFSAILILQGAQNGFWIPTPRPVWADNSGKSSSGQNKSIEILASFSCDAVDALFYNLEAKAKQLGKKNSQIGFFLLTNLALMMEFARKSELMNMLGPNGGERLDKIKKRAVNLFLEDWKQVASHLMDVTIVKTGNKPLSSKDREIIKEKFKTFNAEFDALVARHKNYRISDPLLREELKKEISFISPLYNRFYDRHIGGDFSKNVDKYIKYSTKQFDKILNSLG